jgi:hypothetical protein
MRPVQSLECQCSGSRSCACQATANQTHIVSARMLLVPPSWHSNRWRAGSGWVQLPSRRVQISRLPSSSSSPFPATPPLPVFASLAWRRSGGSCWRSHGPTRIALPRRKSTPRTPRTLCEVNGFQQPSPDVSPAPFHHPQLAPVLRDSPAPTSHGFRHSSGDLDDSPPLSLLAFSRSLNIRVPFAPHACSYLCSLYDKFMQTQAFSLP